MNAAAAVAVLGGDVVGIGLVYAVVRLILWRRGR